MKFENLGDWCKWLEKNFSNDIMIPKLPVIIRLDGNNFSKWTNGLKKPFDEKLTDLMVDTTKFLVKETNAIVGYTQSDEITLILFSDDKDENIYHDGKKQKILSKLTSKCSNYFNEQRQKHLPGHNKIADFDCRIYQTPTLHDACAQLLWRENDATKNSISMLAQSMFSHNSLNNKNGSQKQDRMMLEKGVNWNDLPTRYKRGTYVKRTKVSKKLSSDELELLPAKHAARQNPDLIIERNIIQEVEYPIFQKIKNKVGVIFNNEEPVLTDDNPKKGIDLEKLSRQLDEALANETKESLEAWMKENGHDDDDKISIWNLEEGYNIVFSKKENKGLDYNELSEKFSELLKSYSKEDLEKYLKEHE